MNRIRHTSSSPGFPGNSSIYPHENIFSDNLSPSFGKFDNENDFSSKLKECITSNDGQQLQNLIQQQPDAWSATTPEQLGTLLLQAVKKNRSSMVDELIKKSAPGKAAAIPMGIQLELVEAARLRHNDQSKLADLLNALLPDADFPVQHLQQLVQEALKEGKHALNTALSEYKDAFLKSREQGGFSIYDAAAAGDPVKLLKELDAKLGIPPLDNSLTGAAWFFNALHRWVAELFAAHAAETLVNQPMGNVPLLHAAVTSGNAETVRLLLERGAKSSTLDRHGRSALSKANELRNREICNLLGGRHLPDRRSGSDGVAAPTYAAGERGTIAPIPTDETRVNGPSENEAKSFKTLLAEATLKLPRPADLARELNANTPISLAQGELFTVGYMADFQPPRASNGAKRRLEQSTQSSDAVHQLQVQSESFRNEGARLEASKAENLHKVLDRMIWPLFGELLNVGRHVENNLQSAGLCKLLIDLVEAALVNAGKDERWVSPSDEFRKQVFSGCLQEQLNQLRIKRPTLNEQEDEQTIYDRLLCRQISVLEKYCKSAEPAHEVDTWGTTDFSHDFY